MAMMIDVAGFIYGQMKKNAVSDAVSVMNAYNISWFSGTSTAAMIIWASMVKSKAPWDHSLSSGRPTGSGPSTTRAF